MKILLIGAHGTIGSAVAKELAPRHEIVTAGVTRGQHQADVADPAQVAALFDRVGRVDAVIVAAGKLHFGPLAEFTPEQFGLGLRDKLMGQVNVAQMAQRFVNDGGSITLTGGSVSHQPIRFGAGASMVNSALEGYVRGAAVELARGIRINLVSPTVLEESLADYGPFFRGVEAVPARRVALAYSRSVEGAQTGQVYRVW